MIWRHRIRYAFAATGNASPAKQRESGEMVRHELNEALKQALKAREPVAVRTLRLILAALKDRDIAARSRGNTDGITEPDIMSMLRTMIRQREESTELYEQGGRLDLAQAEVDEIQVIERFLPTQMDEPSMHKAVQSVIAEIGAKGLKDVGRTMAELRARHAGHMDFGKASDIVRGSLG